MCWKLPFSVTTSDILFTVVGESKRSETLNLAGYALEWELRRARGD